MQVSQIPELDTHAVIGGGKARAFGMSDSAEFFTVLSDTLYRDKKRAVVREVICNAWDAHIMVGQTDLPIEITLTDDELVIKDFGPGIADDRIVPIYCVYGASTKVADLNQTGGFGLGSKAPFAYSDHFSVTSCHKGFRTVYAISRGGVETDGKPEIRTMVKVKTDETGITVSVPLKNRSDKRDFESHILQVVRQGGIRANLNGDPLTSIDFTEFDKNGFGLLMAQELNEGAVYVRYGTVLYPLTTTNMDIVKLCKSFSNTAGLKLILVASPGSIGVTPSREALSYSEKTIAALTRLIKRAIAIIRSHRYQALRALAEKQVAGLKELTIRNEIKTPVYDKAAGEPLQMAIMAMAVSIECQKAYRHHELETFRATALEQERTILKVVMHKNRDHRRMLRRVIGKGREAYFDRFIGLNGWNFEGGRLIYRLAARHGVLRDMHRVDGASRGVRLVSFRKHARAFQKAPRLILARNREHALGYIAANGSYDAAQDIAFLMVRNLKPEQIEAIKATAAGYKMKVEHLSWTSPVRNKKAPKSVKAAATFYDLRAVEGACFHSPMVATDMPKLAFAPVFLNGEGSTEEKFRSSFKSLVKHQNKILRAYPIVALAMNVTQRKALVAAGSRDLREALIEDMLALSNDRKTQLALIAADLSRFVKADYNSSAAVARRLCASDLRYAKLLLGGKSTVTESEVKVFNLLHLYMTGIGLDTKESAAYKHQFAIRQAATKIFDLKRFSSESLDYLNPILMIASHLQNDIPYSDDLFETIRFLQRRANKSRLTYHTQPLKEAA